MTILTVFGILACAVLDIHDKPAQGPAIVLFGDSTTATRGSLRIFARILAEKLPKRGMDAVVINAGVGGNNTQQARKRFKGDVLDRKPDYVTIFFGLNDAAVDVWKGKTKSRVSVNGYDANLRFFVEKLREKGAKPILMTPNPTAWTPDLKERYGKAPYDPGDPECMNRILEGYVTVVRAVASDLDVPLVDVYQLFKKYAKTKPIQDLLLDGMHPNDTGHAMIAKELLPLIR